MDLASILQPILQNQVVTGISFTALLGGAMYQLRSIPHLVHMGSMRFFTVELTVFSSDPAFDWIDRWLALQPYAKNTKMMQLRALDAETDDRTSTSEWTIGPGAGTHMFRWRGRPVLLTRYLMSKDTPAGMRSAKPLETLHFRTFGRSQAAIRGIIEEARLLSAEKDIVPIRIWDEYSWAMVKGKSPRSLDTVILKDGQCDRIVRDLERFFEAREWYLLRGIPYRRGYLFVGPPGTGKTSIVLALAAHIGRPICVLNLGSVVNDNALFEAIRAAPVNAVILLEDIDCAHSAQARTRTTDDNEDAAEGDNRGISKAALLNALDGITTPDGRIFIMTSNFPERLDAALIRPGRADVCETFDYFDANEQIKMSRRFFDSFEPLPFPVSPAEMQAAFMQHPSDPEAARAHLYSKFKPILQDAA